MQRMSLYMGKFLYIVREKPTMDDLAITQKIAEEGRRWCGSSFEKMREHMRYSFKEFYGKYLPDDMEWDGYHNRIVVTGAHVEKYLKKSKRYQTWQAKDDDRTFFQARPDIYRKLDSVTRQAVSYAIKKYRETYGDIEEEKLKSPTDIVMELLGIEGTTQSVPFIPEILVVREQVVARIIEGISDYAQTHDVSIPTLSFAWSVYAGMGAVALWNDDWPSLRDKGVFESLTAERGLFAMDEFAFDVAGIGFGSPEADAFTEEVHNHSFAMVSEMMELQGENDKIRELFWNYCLAGYHFGMVYQMRRLGMK